MSVILPVEVEECLWSPSPLAGMGRDGTDIVLIVLRVGRRDPATLFLSGFPAIAETYLRSRVCMYNRVCAL